VHILLIDDHALFREALTPLLRTLDAEVIVIEASTAKEAWVAAKCYPNIGLVLLDLGLPDGDGIELVETLREICTSANIVVVSGETNPDIVWKSIDAGARGFVPKALGIQGLMHALAVVSDGEVFLPLNLIAGQHEKAEPSNQSEPSIDLDARKASGLTARQLRVLKLVAEGHPNKTIARRLDIAEGTVKLHVSAILRTFGANNRTEAVVEATRQGLLDDGGS
jgi:DNA-binding NarL/FixJ family response regulator